MFFFITLATGVSVIAASRAHVSASSATSGSVFDGHHTRTYAKPSVSSILPGVAFSVPRSHVCSYYAVVTTIFEPSAAVAATCARLPDWCLVIVADKKGPPSYHVDGPCDFIYLSVDDQEELARTSDFVAQLPWNHFGRKNVGYLYAIKQGAASVWDFDDDNELIASAKDMAAWDPGMQKFGGAVKHRPTRVRGGPLSTTKTATDSSGAVTTTISEAGFARTVSTIRPSQVAAFNPYPSLGATNFSWPRGFPLEQINNDTTHSAVQLVTNVMVSHSIGVVQSLANFNPDVDAIYRLTRPLPLEFEGGSPRPIVVPGFTFVPFNAQATLFASHATWALYLPVTVHGRVSDIWRSYIAQRLMWDVGLMLAFDGPWVRQVRNEHSIIADLDSETFMYLRTDALLQCLGKWRSTAPSLAERIVELYVHLYEREYLEREDVVSVEGWVRELVAVKYKFPRLIL